MQVREIMTENPACCTPETSLEEVAQKMVEHDCGCIPVVDSHLRMKPVGTITDRDITVRTVAAGKNPVGMKASDIMSIDIATVSPDTSLEECFNVMEDREIRRVLVVDKSGACCGIVAQADVVQSGKSAERTNRVVREISESSPSRTMTMSRQNKGRKSESLINGKAVLPFLVGLSGAGLLYYLGNRNDETRQVKRPVTSSGPGHVRQTNTTMIDMKTPPPPATDAASTAPMTSSTETRQPITGSIRPSSEADDLITKPEIGRVAKP